MPLFRTTHYDRLYCDVMLRRHCSVRICQLHQRIHVEFCYIVMMSLREFCLAQLPAVKKLRPTELTNSVTTSLDQRNFASVNYMADPAISRYI